MKPTIGRRVWYFSNEFDRVHHPDPVAHNDTSQPLDAGICYVWSDTMVNLTVADQNGAMHARASVRLLGEGEAPEEGCAYATWMPYQTAKAAEEAKPEPKAKK